MLLLQVRLLMCYVATHPEKLDATKQQQWQKLAGLSAEDMTTITNLEFLGVPVRKQNKTKGLNFGRKRKRAVRKVRALCQGLKSLGFSKAFRVDRAADVIWEASRVGVARNSVE